jgi:hypothetical protein
VAGRIRSVQKSTDFGDLTRGDYSGVNSFGAVAQRNVKQTKLTGRNMYVLLFSATFARNIS